MCTWSVAYSAPSNSLPQQVRSSDSALLSDPELKLTISSSPINSLNLSVAICVSQSFISCVVVVFAKSEKEGKMWDFLHYCGMGVTPML